MEHMECSGSRPPPHMASVLLEAVSAPSRLSAFGTGIHGNLARQLLRMVRRARLLARSGTSRAQASSPDPFPHLLFHGPPAAGKRALIAALVRELEGSGEGGCCETSVAQQEIEVCGHPPCP